MCSPVLNIIGFVSLVALSVYCFYKAIYHVVKIAFMLTGVESGE